MRLATVGDILAGKYRVDKILGIGGMGMVVAATHLELEQKVALKFMLPSAMESPEAAARFLREAKAAGRLNSEHICRVIDVGRFDTGAPYIVMEYLQGHDLNSHLKRRGPLRVSEAIDYILQATEGLAEAHAHGIVHRDLKPDNLFLAKRNDGGTTVKVLDFGISKAAVTGIATKTGDVMGSPAYMAPEQMQSTKGVDARADIWSLGVVLYQITTGRPPFLGETLPQLCLKVMNDDPGAMSEIRADLPDGFEAVVMRCLHKDPDARFADVGELAEALAPFGGRDASTTATRIQIVLRRATNPSTPEISRGFSAIAPTLGNEDFEDPEYDPTTQYRQLEPGEVTVTTVQSSAGESLSSAPREPRPWSWPVVAGMIGGAALLAVVLVMALRSRDAADDPPPPPPPPTPVKVVTPPPPPPQPPPPRPQVEPIDPLNTPLVMIDAGVPVVVVKKKPKPDAGAEAAVELDAGAGSAADGSAGSDDVDWTHMTHDKQP